MQRSNMILIHIESFDGRQLGFWGDPALKKATPAIDAIAREGVIFSNSYTSHPICCPARANLWTSTYSFRHESWSNYKGLEAGTRRFQHVLEQEGYVFASKQGGIGKHDYLSGHHSVKGRVGDWTGPVNIKLPFWKGAFPKVIPAKHLFFTDKTKMMDWNSLRKARKFLKDQVRKGAGKQANPFFLYFSLVLPHPPYRTHEHRLKKIDLDAISLPKAENYRHPVIEFQKTLKNWRHGFDANTVKLTRGVYYAMISEADAVIGELVRTLKDLKIYDDTYLIITADHGDNQLEHGQSLKSNMFESAAKVPLIIRGPDLEKGKICHDPVDTTDIFPTLLDFACIPRENVKERYNLDFDLDGESLFPLCVADPSKRTGPRKKDYAFSMYTGVGTNTTQFMLRQGDWKYWVFPGYEPLLFNLSRDPDEILDFSGEHPEILEKMDAKLREIVDYEAVHRRHLDYCRQALNEFEQQCNRGEISFRKGKHLYMNVKFDDVFKIFYKGWGDEHAAQLRQFMAGVENKSSMDKVGASHHD